MLAFKLQTPGNNPEESIQYLRYIREFKSSFKKMCSRLPRHRHKTEGTQNKNVQG
jgi:hypothetical protein